MQDKDKLFQVFGTEELVNIFQGLDFTAQNKILTSSFKKASKLIIDESINNLRGSYKNVQASMGTVMQRNIQTLNVGLIRKKGGHLSHIVNAGTKERSYTSKYGKLHRTGKITGNKFWDNAMQSTEQSVEEAIYNDVKQQFKEQQFPDFQGWM